MKVISIYAPIPGSQYRTSLGSSIASNSNRLISALVESGCELILHHNSGQAYFSFPDGFAHQSIINVASDWRIATHLYNTTGVQHTNYLLKKVRGVMRYAGVNIHVSETEFHTDYVCFDNYSVDPNGVPPEQNLTTVDMSIVSRGTHTLYDIDGNVVIEIVSDFK